MQVSLAARVRSREHASLFANLAEDLGATRGIGTRSAAERAIRASDALGGSPTAYQLAAAYAAEDGQPEVAAGILARGRLRCFQMRSPGISPKGFAEERVRVDLRGQNRSRRYSY